MASKVFISWSGDVSRKLAEAIRDWLPNVLQFSRPYFTPNDIEKGARWSNDIATELESSDVGLICLTQDNIAEPWILFEAGALSKNFDKSRVCTIAFDLETSDIVGPLTVFQNTRFEKDDFKRLITTINSTDSDSALKPETLESVFEMWWPQLEENVTTTLKNQRRTGKSANRTQKDILEEILELTRMTVQMNRGPRREIASAVDDLMRIMSEMLPEFSHQQEFPMTEKFFSEFLYRISRPLEFICDSAGMREAFYHFSKSMGKAGYKVAYRRRGSIEGGEGLR